MSIHRAVWNWLGGCAGIAGRFFNFGQARSGGAVLLPSDVGDGPDYIDGARQRAYSVELVRVLPLTFEAEDTGNIDMLEDMDAIAAWIAAKAAAGEYPEFPEGCRVTGINVSDPQAVTAMALDGALARYALSFTIHYIRQE